jgi:hypothetical protein
MKPLTIKLTLLALSVAVSGCSGMSIPKDYFLRSQSEIKEEFDKSISASTPPVRVVKLNGRLAIDGPGQIPDHVRNKYIKVVFSKNATLDDLAAVLSSFGFYMIVPDASMREMGVVIFNYEGQFGDFLNALSVAHDMSFSWLPGNIIAVTQNKPYILQIPQNENIANAIADNISAMGASDVKTSLQAGTIYYKANHHNQMRIAEMIQKMSINASVVSMQVAIVSVTLDHERNTGFDWSSLKIGIGAQDLQQSTNTSGGAVSAISSVLKIGSNLTDLKGHMGINSGGVSLNLAKGDFTFNSAYRMLSTYGEAQTTQSVVMDSLSGEEVTLKSGYKIPYIDSIGVSSLNNNNGTLGSTSVKEADVGLDLKLVPFYDNRSEAVTINVDLSLSSLIRFIDLSAGNQLGSLSRPMIQSQNFTDLVKVKAGESIIIGGITYDQISDNRSNLTLFEKSDSASQAKKTNKTAMFIIMRPTVTVFAAQDAMGN